MAYAPVKRPKGNGNPQRIYYKIKHTNREFNYSDPI